MMKTAIVLYYALVGVVSFFLFATVLTQQPNTKLPTREPIHRRW